MSSILGRVSSPVNNDGTRDRVYFETCINGVVDPQTGKTLNTILTEMKEPMATELVPGLMSPEDKATINRLYEREVIVSDINPDRECIWIENIVNDEEL